MPFSSTAHLRIEEKMMGLSLTDSYWKMFTIVIQLGAILVLPIYFRDRIAKFLSTFPRGERSDRTIFTHPLSLVAVAFVVTAIPSLLLVAAAAHALRADRVFVPRRLSDYTSRSHRARVQVTARREPEATNNPVPSADASRVVFDSPLVNHDLRLTERTESLSLQTLIPRTPGSM